MEESRGAKAANDSHFSRRRRWRLEYLAGNGCVVFPRLLGWVSTIVNGPTQHRRGRLDTAFSYEKAYETILTLTLTKQALRDGISPQSTYVSRELNFHFQDEFYEIHNYDFIEGGRSRSQ